MSWLLVLAALMVPASTDPTASSGNQEGARRLTEEALSLLKQDLYEDALDAAGSAVEMWPEHAPAHTAKAMALYRRGDFIEAERHYRRAVELDPDHAPGHYGVGRILRTLGKYAEAAESFSKAAALAPDVPKYMRTLSNHLQRREDSLELLRRYLVMVKYRPESTDTTYEPLESKATIRNVEAWVALLESLGDRPLNHMTRADPGSIRLEVSRLQPYMRMAVAGIKSQRFVFDTGATGLTISPRIAARAKLEPIRPFTIVGTGGGRTETGDLVLIDEIALGEGIVIRNVPATVRDPAGPEEGLVGPSMFSRFNVTVDLKKRRLTLGPKGEVTPGRVEPFRNVGGQIMVTARLDDVPLNAMVDTGSTTTIVGTTAVSRIPGLSTVPGSWISGPIVGVGGPIADRRMILSGGFSLASRSYPADGLPTGDLSGFSRALESEVYMILGVPHLDDSAFTIDYEAMTVTFAQDKR